MFYNISQVLGITIIHSLWQGLIIYLLLRILFLCMPALTAVKKYNLAIVALLGITTWFACTFCMEARGFNWDAATAVSALPLNMGMNGALPADIKTTIVTLPAHQATFAAYKTELYYSLKGYLPYISILYAIGLLVNLGQLGLAWNRIRVIKQNLLPAELLQQQVNSFAQQLNISKYIHVNFTQLVDVPCVIGYFMPILLLPVTLTTQLSADEVKAIFLHELAHIKNNDYLLNIIQQMMSVLLFFNPFAQLINKIISTERENRCDDRVVQATGSPLIYAHALLKLEETRQTNPELALAATGKKYTLLTRIERIMKAQKPIVNTRHLALAIIIFIGSIASISWLSPGITQQKTTTQASVTEKPNSAHDMQQYLIDTKKLVDKGKYKEALQRDIWFHNHALEYNKGMKGVRLSFALSDWKRLADIYPPAMTAFVSTRDRKTQELINNTGSPDLFADVAAFNRELKDDARTIALFQLLVKNHPDAAQGYWHAVNRQLFAAKRYDIIHKYIGDPMKEFETAKRIYNNSMAYSNNKKDMRFSAQFKEANNNMLVNRSIDLIQYELAEKDINSAKKIQQQAMLLVTDDRLRNAVPN